MIGRRKPPQEPEQPSLPKGFDDYDVRLGDIMRGERATFGKSLLDVQRELKIKAAYIAAIENADTAAFETPGFIAGYVRSYARYLGLDPDWAYATFCDESGFSGGTSLERGAASGMRPSQSTTPAQRVQDRDPIAQPRISFAPERENPFSAVEPRAIASILVLVGLIGGIGYGGWSVLQEVQKVQLTPVDRAPEAIAEVDPLDGAVFAERDLSTDFSGIGATTPDALDRLYRPEALDVPVMVARDGPIAALDPDSVGALAAANRAGPGPEVVSGDGGTPAPGGAPRLGVPQPQGFGAQIAGLGQPAARLEGTPRVTAANLPEVMLVAVGEVWLRVTAADGTVINERIMQSGDTYIVPPTEEPPSLRVGSAGAVYFAVNGVTHGPAGDRGAVVSDIALGPDSLTQQFAQVQSTDGSSAQQAIQVAEAALRPRPQPTPGSDGAETPTE